MVSANFKFLYANFQPPNLKSANGKRSVGQLRVFVGPLQANFHTPEKV